MNNEKNPLQKPKRPILTGNEKVDELLEDGYQCQMSIYNRWLQSQSLPAEPKGEIPYILNQWQVSELKAYLTRRARDYGGISYENINQFIDDYQTDMQQPSQPDPCKYCNGTGIMKLEIGLK